MLEFLLIFFIVLGLFVYVTVSIFGALIFTKSAGRAGWTQTPAHYGLRFEEISFPATKDGLTIRGWFVPSKSERVVLVLHGLGANRADVLEPAVPLAQNGFNLLLIDLRGHGTSDGKICSYGYYEQRDVLAALNYLKERGFMPEHTGILSYSMGAATALVVMSYASEVKALVSDSAFSNLNRELKHALPLMTGGRLPLFCLTGMILAANLLRGINVKAVRPEEAVKKLNGRRVLFIHGEQDKVVPLENIYRLQEAAGDGAEAWIVPGTGHVGSYNVQPREYTRRLLAFFKREL